jgi:hypothetical protein
MSPVHVLDRYYLAITALVTIAWQLTGFFIAWAFQVRAVTIQQKIMLTICYRSSSTKSQISREVCVPRLEMLAEGG